MANKTNFSEEFIAHQVKRKTGRSESCIKKITVKVTPSMHEALSIFGSDKSEFVRQAIEEKLEREKDLVFKKVNENTDDFR